MRILAMLAALAATGCVESHAEFLYDWDQEPVVCSAPIDDDVNGRSVELVDEVLGLAADSGAVANLYAHVPGETISIDWLETVLRAADAHALDYVTYDELAGDAHRAGLALAFDDESADAWYAARDQLAAHGARATFFITGWQDHWDAAERAELRALADLGHAVGAHGVHHVHARDYVAEHGIDAFVVDEVLPSITVLRDAGYTPTTFAFPYGESSPEITQAVLQHIDRVRVGPSSCPK